jgi:transaldolase
MKILLASARLQEIQWAAENGLLDGVVTTPSLLASAGADGDARELLGEICRATRGPVYASVRAVNGADILRDGRELAKISDQIVVQVPFVEDAITSMRRLTSDGVRLLATLVFTPAQALLAAKAGATMVSVSVDAFDGIGFSGADTIAEIKGVFEATSCACDILASQLQNTAQVTACALAGADAVALSTPVLRSLLVHPLTDRGLDQFLRELSTQGKSR